MKRREFIHRSIGTGLGAIPLMAPSLAFSSPNSLSWVSPARINPVHAYVLTGAAKGWFRDEGLNLDIRVGAGTSQSVIQVASANSTFGQAASSISCPAIDQGADLINVGQIAYTGFFELASSLKRPVKSAADLRGKTVGVMSMGGTTDTLLDAMSIQAGIDPKSIKKAVTGASASGAAFLERGDVDAFFVFPDSRFTLEKMGAKLFYLGTHDIVPMPGEALLISRQVAANPAYHDGIVKFLRVCRRGLDYMQDEKNYPELIGIVGKYNPIEASDLEKGRAVFSMLKSYFQPTGGVPRLVCNEKEWELGVRTMERMGLLATRGAPITRYVDNSFARKAVS